MCSIIRPGGFVFTVLSTMTRVKASKSRRKYTMKTFKGQVSTNMDLWSDGNYLLHVVFLVLKNAL